MSGKTTIEWTAQPGYVGAVWNPTTGCTRVSAGCDNCYAFALHDKRYLANRDAAKAHGESSSAMMRAVLTTSSFGVDRDLMPPFPKQYDLPFSRVQLLPDRLDVPLRTRKPTCYFVDSMADLFHEDVPDEFIERVWMTMREATHHRFLILTKRPERMKVWVGEYQGGTWDLPNVWLGTSVEDQRSADERIPHLLATPAAVRFLSCEPLLGPVDLWKPAYPWPDGGSGTGSAFAWGNGIQWVIVGGESGARARPMDLAWARSLVAQCRAAGVAPFVKQLGAHAHIEQPMDAAQRHPRTELLLREPHGRDLDEWPEDLRVREFPRG